MSRLLTPEVFRTEDPDLAHEHILEAYRLGRQAQFASSRRQVRCETVTFDLGGTRLNRLDYTADLSARFEDGLESPIIVSAIGPTSCAYSAKQSTLVTDAGHSVQAPPGVAYRAEWSAMRCHVVMLDLDTLRQDAGAADDAPRLHFGHAVSALAEQHWRATCSHVRSLVQSSPELADSPVLQRELVRLLNTAALMTFPSSTLDPEEPTIGRPVPASVRRAVTYLDEHVQEPVALADIAAAARLSPRALQAAFRRHLDTTPLGYLRRVRMAHAHQDLLTAAPGGDATVASIAHRWGFTHLGHFARAHAVQFGTQPRDVLWSEGPSSPR